MADKFKKGDSIWYDVTGDISDIDPTWINWSGKWDLLTEIGQPALHTGSLTRTVTAGKFLCQVPLSDADSLDPGNYLLCIQVENTGKDYRKEVAQIKITIQPQGVA